ncbi:MarR family transcriptional regulator [Nocardioides baekrokdamisoli]|uniref:MarR family transcriptional regulator n=1 Tax=Nocardioides baekrokdamisoli TaxID=1804624 RepID=A0A3G9IE94_9ACTN|nr:MarR family winged helix-turn-helix transcriptional regulator [Nocardioides baekrokdamisoli]BBH16682.1 MarR family transcriptional regulator [Nocardioides baekrokdamisoli]
MPQPATEIVMYAARLIRQVRRELDLPAYIRVLSLLDELGPTGISQLATADNCAQPTMSAQIRQIELDGYVSRRPHPDDARSSLIELTAAGRTELATMRTALGAAAAARLGDCTPAEVATTIHVLRTLTSEVSE